MGRSRSRPTDRPTWRRTVKTGATVYEANRIAATKVKREACKSQMHHSSKVTHNCFTRVLDVNGHSGHELDLLDTSPTVVPPPASSSSSPPPTNSDCSSERPHPSSSSSSSSSSSLSSSSFSSSTAPTTAAPAAVTHINTTHIPDTATDTTPATSDSRG
ncbi:hypothetical protein SprV_0301217500 [Sparganum proliferum]